MWKILSWSRVCEVQQAFHSFNLCFSCLFSSLVWGLFSVSFPMVVMLEQMAYMYSWSCLGKWNLEGFFPTYPLCPYPALFLFPSFFPFFPFSSCCVSQAGLGTLTWSSVRCQLHNCQCLASVRPSFALGLPGTAGISALSSQVWSSRREPPCQASDIFLKV